MKSEQYDKLTDEEKRDQVAKAAGVSLEDIMTGKLPDYLNDLNAMHKAEAMLNPGAGNADGPDIRWNRFVSILVSRDVQLGSESALHATAAQRAKAFVLTMTGEYEC